MFRSANQRLKFTPENDMSVIVRARVSIYEVSGDYQIYVDDMQPDGVGALAIAFEQLKKKLAASGIFDPEHKKPIPEFPRRVGVVTSESGAAVRDIINVITRRYPLAEIILYPVAVQGSTAAEQIAGAIRYFNSEKAADVLIVGRGGGSIEDLWAFNEEMVAQAIFDCPIPIISAVGHETDTTIADYVADRRAPTPSAAAELAVFEYNRFLQDLEDYSFTLNKEMGRKITALKMLQDRYKESLRLLSPAGRIKDRLLRLDQYQDSLQGLMDKKVRELRHRLDLDIERLKGLSPLDRLKGGYSYVADDHGNNVRSISGINAGDKLSIFVTDGVINADVSGTDMMNNEYEN
jgi:exodeoxyribonuclease VII large subunit